MRNTHAPSVIDQLPHGLYIDGEWLPARGHRAISVQDPATGTAIAAVADGSGEDGLAALQAAAAQQEAWANETPRERSDLLLRMCGLMMECRDSLATLITLEMGKPLAQARAEVDYSADFLRWFSAAALHIDGRFSRAPSGNQEIMVTRRPVGPSLLLTPWNFPLAMAARKLAPALAAGCTTILKPADLTPLTALAFVRIAEDAGAPPGVVNLITTADSPTLVAAIMEDDRLRKVSFTGSTAVGQTLLRQSARGVVRVSLELGGNAPFVILEDADLQVALEGAMTAKLRNAGQSCTAANRFLVHRALVPAFATEFARRVAQVRVGPGAHPATEVGPMISERQRHRVHQLVTDALTAGATALTGARLRDGPGWFYEPTVLVDVPADARVVREEIFGPVAPILAFEDEEEAAALANATEYGLAAFVYSRDVGHALRLARRIETGMVGINRGLVSDAAAPFGGVKASGVGREGGHEGIAAYLETHYAALSI